jgi:hypothetical protein
MTKSEPRLRQRTDGRLDRSRDPAILNAALAMLTENDYRGTRWRGQGRKLPAMVPPQFGADVVIHTESGGPPSIRDHPTSVTFPNLMVSARHYDS